MLKNNIIWGESPADLYVYLTPVRHLKYIVTYISIKLYQPEQNFTSFFFTRILESYVRDSQNHRGPVRREFTGLPRLVIRA